MYSIFGLGWVSNGLRDVICPQGSILGPMIFKLYVPDLQITSNAKHIYIHPMCSQGTRFKYKGERFEPFSY